MRSSILPERRAVRGRARAAVVALERVQQLEADHDLVAVVAQAHAVGALVLRKSQV